MGTIVQQFSAQPEVTTPTSPTTSGDTNHHDPTAATLAPLPERIEALNYSLNPWECTGAAPQGWANHLQQSLLPIQGYIAALEKKKSYTGLYSTTTSNFLTSPILWNYQSYSARWNRYCGKCCADCSTSHWKGVEVS